MGLGITIIRILDQRNYYSQSLLNCVVPENIHTPPMEGFSNKKPPSLRKFPFSVILSFLLPLGISINFPWGGCGYFLELHSNLHNII